MDPRAPTGGPVPRLSVLVLDGGAEGASVPEDLLGGQTLARDTFEVHRVEIGAGDPARATREAAGVAAAPLCLLLAADSRPAPDLLERHLAAHAARPGSSAVSGLERPAPAVRATGALLFDHDPLAALPGRERAGPSARERFRLGHASLPTAALRAALVLPSVARTPRGLGLALGQRLERAGLELVVDGGLALERTAAPDVEAWLAGQVDLGRDLARLHAVEQDAEILGRARARAGEPLWRPFQQAYESFRASFGAARAVLARADAAGALPAAVRERLAGLVASLSAASVARGVLWERAGRDPEEVCAAGPERGVLTSVIVPSFDALDATRRCVEALRRQREEGFPIEILAVDNGSRDGSREYLAAQADVRLVANAENAGAPRARNQALELAQGAWIVFLDNDVVVTPGWLARLRRHAEVDPYAACVGPVTDRAAHGQAVPFDGSSADARAAEIARESPGAFRMASLLSSFCLLVRRAAIDAVGGFDERFSPWGFEDDDFTLRCALAGWHNRVALDTFVQHAGYAGAKARRHAELLERNWGRFCEKWGLSAARRGDYSGLARHLERAWDPGELYVPFAGAGARRAAEAAV